MRLVDEGAGSSRILQLRGPMMVKGDYRHATMTLANWRKDMAIIAAFAREVGCETPLFSATAPIYAAATARGSHGTPPPCVPSSSEMAHYRRSRPRRTRERGGSDLARPARTEAKEVVMAGVAFVRSILSTFAVRAFVIAVGMLTAGLAGSACQAPSTAELRPQERRRLTRARMVRAMCGWWAITICRAASRWS